MCSPLASAGLGPGALEASKAASPSGQVFVDDRREECVRLTSLYVFAKNVWALLQTYHYQQLFLHELPEAYTKYVGEALHPQTYGHSSVEELLGAIPQVRVVLASGGRRGSGGSPDSSRTC